MKTNSLFFNTKHIILLLVFTFLSVKAFPQTKAINDLKSQQKNTLKKIELTNKILNDTKKSKTVSLNKLNMLNEQISMRIKLINQINEELNLIEKSILDLNENIKKQEEKIKELKEEYAQLMYHTYLRRNSHDKLMFILSAGNFNQSYRRFRYLQEFSNYRKEQGKELEIQIIDLNEKKSTLDKTKKEKLEVLTGKEEESKQLKREENNQKNLVSQLK